MNTIFSGVGVALVTLFDADGGLDVTATADLAVRLAEEGVNAIVVAGSTGEAPALDDDERSALVHAVRGRVSDEIPVIAGTGAPSARQAIRLTAQARDAGADAALVLSPPHTVDPRPYYEAVASTVPDLPLLAYHYPVMSAPGIPVGSLQDLPVGGVKDSSGDPARLLATLDAVDRALYVGSSVLLSLAGPLGATGAILALANAEPSACVAAFAGDVEAQRRLAGPHAAMSPFPAGIKALTAARFGTSASTRMG